MMTAKDGKDGYLAYLLFRPDLVITDIQMPGTNGLEMVAHLRMHNSGIRVIYMSAELDRFRSRLEEEKRKYQVSLLQKPFSRMELMRLISGHGAERRRVKNG